MSPAELPMSDRTAMSSAESLAADLTSRLEQPGGFSFLRLADGELAYLLRVQDTGAETNAFTGRLSIERPRGGPGLKAKDYSRLLRSYEECSYLDLCTDHPYNNENLARLRWKSSRAAGTTVPKGHKGLIVDWLRFEARAYMSRHRCLICGAEAALLQELFRDADYLKLAGEFFDPQRLPVMLQPRNNGSSLSEDLDAIKADIVRAVQEHKVDTILLSLGGAAKILCHELASEQGISALDVGAPLRGYTYSGSVGYAPSRSNHHVHFLRVPLPMYMRALCRAHPTLSTVELVSKAQAQMSLDLQWKEPFASCPSEMNRGGRMDASGTNLLDFRDSYRYYRRHVVPSARGDAAATELVREFEYWLLKNGVDWKGRLFRVAVRSKQVVRRMYTAVRGKLGVSVTCY